MEVSFSRGEILKGGIMLELKIVDSILFLFYILDLGLEVSMTLYVTVTNCYISFIVI